MSPSTVRPAVDRLKALAHPARLRILALLREEELCVCQVREVLGMATSTVSEHLAGLRRADLLEERREGRWVYYRLKSPDGTKAFLDGLWSLLEGIPQVAQDRRACAEVLRRPVGTVCRPGPQPRPERARRAAAPR
ncbi:MAG: winged helix-turn-helix transcriptional regulator [Acidobacteria bacterium]|nr:winged helix-turn-helix transcriptional regulator [Acidobacteriota bacterium]